MSYSHYIQTGHDPIAMHAECEECNAILRQKLNEMADLDLGPKDADALIERIREMVR